MFVDTRPEKTARRTKRRKQHTNEEQQRRNLRINREAMISAFAQISMGNLYQYVADQLLLLNTVSRKMGPKFLGYA